MNATSWRVEIAERMTVVVDADDYFARAREALLQAERRIMLVGWDFDARISLTSGPLLPGEPRAVGEFLHWLVARRPELELYLLRWDLGAVKTLFRGTTLLTMLRWMRHPRIHTKLDGRHPPGASHHQKLMSIDDRFAFCGGIDVTASRWDTRAHRDDDPGRLTPGGAPYQPWHDATVALSGPVAGALAELCRGRWQRATGHTLKPVLAPAAARDAWPPTLPPMFTHVAVAVARTQATVDDDPPVHEVEALFLAQIASAKRWIYFESQYFASRRVAEAIARRLAEPDGPEFVVINPVTAHGWLEPIAMDNARGRLMAALQARDTHDRLRMYHPVTTAGEAIYVHAKITVVDDRQLRVGSANLNNRSMRLDTECDVNLDAGDGGDDDAAVSATIAELRDSLIAEHLGVDPARVTAAIAATGSIIAAVEGLRGDGRSLRPYVLPEVTGIGAWLADNEVLDPEGPGEMFESLSKRGLFRRRLKPPKRRKLVLEEDPSPPT